MAHHDGVSIFSCQPICVGFGVCIILLKPRNASAIIGKFLSSIRDPTHYRSFVRAFFTPKACIKYNTRPALMEGTTMAGLNSQPVFSMTFLH